MNVEDEDEMMSDMPQPPITTALLHVVDYGYVRVSNFSSCLGLAGRRFLLPNNVWYGCETDTGKCNVEMVGYTDQIDNALQLIVRRHGRIYRGYHYVFTRAKLEPHLPRHMKDRMKALQLELELEAELAADFGAPDPSAPPPDLAHLKGVIFERVRELHKRQWLSRLRGACWSGTDEELQQAYDGERARQRYDPANARQRYDPAKRRALYIQKQIDNVFRNRKRTEQWRQADQKKAAGYKIENGECNCAPGCYCDHCINNNPTICRESNAAVAALESRLSGSTNALMSMDYCPKDPRLLHVSKKCDLGYCKS